MSEGGPVLRVVSPSGAILAACVLAGCAGSRGGETRTAPAENALSPPPRPAVSNTAPGDNTLRPVTFDLQRYYIPVMTSFRLLDWALSFGFTISAASATRATEPQDVVYSCEIPSADGRIHIALTDLDKSGSVTAKDHITFTYQECDSPVGRTNAVFDSEVLSMSATEAEWRLRLRTNILNYVLTDRGDVLAVKGSFDTEWRDTANTTGYIVSGAQVEIIDPFGTHTMRNFRQDYLQDFTTLEYRWSVDADVQSSDARNSGTFHVATDGALLGRLGHYPDGGAVTFRGVNGVRLGNGGLTRTGNEGVPICDDFDGDGVYTTRCGSTPSWSFALEARRFLPLREDVAVPP